MKIKNIRGFIKHHKAGAGFTLIELLIVIAILGILSISILLTLNPFTQIQKGNDAKRKADLSQIQKALEVYYQDYGAYPDRWGYVLYPITSAPGVTPVVKTQKDWGSSWQPYMNVIPKDPVSAKKYIYYTSNGQSYYLYASLDRGSKDPQACSGGQCSGAGLANMNTICGSGASAVCNFGVASPDKTP